MAFYICEIKTAYENEDGVTALLQQCGAEGTSVEGAPLIKASIEAGNAEIWDKEQVETEDNSIVVKGFFPADGDYEDFKLKTETALALFAAGFDIEMQSRCFVLEDAAWQDSWKQYYKPFRVGKSLVIKPTWEAYVPEDEDIVIELDPGLAFGTGSHPTTNGALRLIEKYLAPGMKVVDCGCGSGILAVAAAYLGAEKVFAVDIDHDAILATVKNLRLNHLLTKVEVFCADVTKRKLSHLAPFQMVVANIVADVILPLLPHMAPLTAEGGLLIAGGIIAPRKEEVFSALEANGFTVKELIADGDWLTLAAVKN